MQELYTEQDLTSLNRLYDAFTNDGYVAYKKKDNTDAIGRMTFQDLVSTPDATRFIPQTVTRVIREALEPALVVVPNCFQTVRIEQGQIVRIGSVGAIYAAKIPEGTEYPTASWNYGEGDMVTLTVSKYGLQIMVTEEVIINNLWDVFGMFLRYAGRALARLQETEAIKMLDSFGTTVFDNSFPAQSQMGCLTGRGIDAAQNGTMTANDVFDMYAWLQMRGFSPNTLLMNPLAWRMFMTDAETREVVLKGAVLSSNRLPNGGPSQGWGTEFNGMGIRTGYTGTQTPATAGKGEPNTLGKIGANPWVNTLNPLSATFNIPPGDYLPTPVKVLVTPYINYAPSASVGGSGKSDLIMLDSDMAGILGTNGQGMSTEEFNKPEVDIRAMKVRQFWGFGVLEQGRAVAVARDVVIDRNYNFENVNSKALSALNHTSTF